MDIEVIALHGGYANSYLLKDGNSALLIDPGYNEEHCLEKRVVESGCHLLGILITHGHYDHFAGLKNWSLLPTPPVFFPKDDEECLENPVLNVSRLFEIEGTSLHLGFYPVEDEDEIAVGPFLLKAIATPFHTKGSVCYYDEFNHALFAGDTLFKDSIGRTDLPGGDEALIASSLAKLAALPEDTDVYPGHGEMTTIGHEVANNPFFRS